MMGGRIFLSDGDGSTPGPWFAAVTEPVLAVWPIALTAFGAYQADVRQVYRLAYEAALESARAWRYEWASRVSRN